MNGLLRRIISRIGRNQISSICPVCNKGGISFVPLPSFYRENAERHGYDRFGQGEMISVDRYSCSSCGASDRERIFAYWIDEMVRSGRFEKGKRLIHFAPEQALSRKIKSIGLFEYKTADLIMENVDYAVDMMSMQFDDSSFDFFICSHVLEHVESDDSAIEELYRITSKGGCGILVAPISIGLETTLEDPSIVTEEGRWKNYGQNDHLRLYAHNDYVNKIKSHGFELQELGIEHFGKRLFHRLGLKDTSILYIAEKR